MLRKLLGPRRWQKLVRTVRASRTLYPVARRAMALRDAALRRRLAKAVSKIGDGNARMNAETVKSIIENPPLLHFWGGEWNTGGFHPGHLVRMMHYLSEAGGGRPLRIAETGAGSSTAMFVAMGAEKVVSIAPDAELFQRILAYLEEKQVGSDSLEFYTDLSENVLPKIAFRNAGTFDGVLLDGGHGWPTVFVDFCYLNMMLREGGIMILDDLQLHSVQELFRQLLQQPEFEILEQINKIAIFRKKTSAPLLKDFGAQPYIRDHEAYVLEDRVFGDGR